MPWCNEQSIKRFSSKVKIPKPATVDHQHRAAWLPLWLRSCFLYRWIARINSQVNSGNLTYENEANKYRNVLLKNDDTLFRQTAKVDDFRRLWVGSAWTGADHWARWQVFERFRRFDQSSGSRSVSLLLGTPRRKRTWKKWSFWISKCTVCDKGRIRLENFISLHPSPLQSHYRFLGNPILNFINKGDRHYNRPTTILIVLLPIG